MRGCSRASMRPARLMGAVYREILDRMMRADWKDPGRRIALSGWRKIWLILRHGIV